MLHGVSTVPAVRSDVSRNVRRAHGQLKAILADVSHGNAGELTAVAKELRELQAMAFTLVDHLEKKR